MSELSGWVGGSMDDRASELMNGRVSVLVSVCIGECVS